VKTMTHRIPYWLSPYELDALVRLLSKDTDLQNRDVLEGIRNEIGVAKIRAESTLINTASLIIALGLVEGSLPIHLSDDEVSFLKTLDGLSQNIKAKLS
jgi:hypothetical protein